MKRQTFGALAGVSLCGLLCLLLLTAKSGGQTTAVEQWGLPSRGLQASLSVIEQYKIGEPEFQVALRNIGKEEIIVKLGMMIGGKAQPPGGLHLILTDANGVKQELHPSSGNIAGVAGHVEHYVVTLRPGKMDTFKLKLSRFWSPSTKETELKLNPGKYQLFAQLEGYGAKSRNGVKVANSSWALKLQSNVLSIKIQPSVVLAEP